MFTRIVSLPVMACLLTLTGCQSMTTDTTTMPLSDDSETLTIKHQNLSQLSLNSRALLTLNYETPDKQKVLNQVVTQLPHLFEIKKEDLPDLVSVDVRIEIDSKIQLTGNQSFLKGEDRSLELNVVGERAIKNTFWRATDISGRGIPIGGMTTLAILDNGMLSGHSGCNQYRSAFNSTAAYINIQQPRLTRKICSVPVMYHENRYLQLLQKAEYFQITDDQHLNLYVVGESAPVVFEKTTADAVRLSIKSY